MGDPVLATVTGLLVGLVESDTAVTLAGGTQLLTAAALARHVGVETPIRLATTSFVAADDSLDLQAAAQALDVDLTVTDPGFEGHDHPAMDAYVAGEAKEGVGMGGALALADAAGVPMADVRDRMVTVYDRLLDGTDRPEPEL
jgi:NaMN:DMB phosphoribosyltransferase